MKNYLVSKYVTCILLWLMLCANREKAYAQAHIEVKYNKTIETIMILRAISADDYFFKRIHDDYKKRPLLYEARKYFAKYKAHAAVSETQKILNDTKDIGGILFQGVLCAEELPGSKIIYDPDMAFWKEDKTKLSAYMTVLQKFYKEANVEGFFMQYDTYYSGAIKEAKGYMNDSLIIVMEQYFGKRNNSYTLLLLPLSAYGWGFSATTSVRGGAKNQYAIVSPVGNTEWKENLKDYKEFGFAGEEAKAHYRELVIHEFVHAFITNVLDEETNKKLIARYISLYTPSLDSAMQDEGYGDWWGFVNEHIVRAAEIKIAAQINKAEAEEMLKNNVISGFVLLPDAVKLFAEYEKNRTRCKTIDTFLPVLINQFAQFKANEIDRRLKMRG